MTDAAPLAGNATIRDLPEGVPRHAVALAGALLASLALHLAIVVAASGSEERSDASRAASSIVARIQPPTPPVEAVPPPPERATAPIPPPTPTKTTSIPLPPTVAPRPKAPEVSSWVEVIVAHDTEPAIEAMFEDTLRRDHPQSQRIPLEFQIPPVVSLAPEAMVHYPQRMLRALVQVKPHGELELLQTHEYDVPYIDAIREALHAARAWPTPDQEIRWAILVFWFQRMGPVAER